MEEILKQDKSKSHKEFEKLLTEDLESRKFKEGEITTGTVEEIGKKFVFIDLGLKSSGAIPIEEFKLSKEIDKIAVGKKIDVLLEKIENKDGEIVVSRQKALKAHAWAKLAKAYESKENVTGKIICKVKGGFAVSVDSCMCFLPGSQVDLRPLKNVDFLIKTPQTFEVVKMDERRGNIVLSRRAIMEKIRDKGRSKLIAKLKEGDVVQGVVKSIVDWGVFVDLSGLDSLLHITDISWSRINKPSELLSIGQQIKVKITKIENEKNKISVSMKHLVEDPYSKIINKYEVGKKYAAVVTKVQEYGCFARLEDGLEGLIHQSELSWTKKNVHPGKILSTSQSIEVLILDKDIDKRRLSLSYKNTMVNPWKKFAQDHKVGDKLEGTIKNITEYGLFANIKNTELCGIIHFKDLSWSEKESELQNYKKNQIVFFKILEVNEEAEKIRLGIKQLSEDPFEFFANKKKGDIITAVVDSPTKNGIYVHVGNKNLSIFIKQNQLAKESADARPSRFTRGDKIDAMIFELNKSKKMLVLSIKALEEKQTEDAVKKFGSKDSGGVLGEILGPLIRRKNKK